VLELDEDEFKRKFPKLYEEIKQETKRYPLIDLLEDRPPLIPDAIDYLRRCKSNEEAEEVINYLERTKEISVERANELRKQLRSEGLKSFGSYKGPYYYSCKYLKNLNIKKIQRKPP